MSNSSLFSSYSLNGLELKNKVVMAPMTRSRAVDKNKANELIKEYYAQRAGAGLIITEGTSPSPNGLGYPRIPGLFNQVQADSWKPVTAAVHEQDSKIFVQLMHTGRVGHQLNLPEGGEVLAPSSIEISGEMYTDKEGSQPHTLAKEMTTEDIKEAIQEYATSAKLAIDAGFDGVELHGANGYLIEQFLHPGANKREDEYGGSIEGRTKFLVEVAKATVSAIGKDKVGLRVSPYGVFNDTGEFEGIEDAYKYLAEQMKAIGIAYIHIVDHKAMGAPAVPEKIKTIIKDTFGGPIIISGGYDKKRAEADLERGLGHLVAFGRPFISNPDLVERMKAGAELAEMDPNTLYTPGAEGYTDYAALEKTKA